MFSTNLLRFCVESVLVLDRCAAQLQFLKGIANERSAPTIVKELFAASWKGLKLERKVNYCKYIVEYLFHEAFTSFSKYHGQVLAVNKFY